MTTVFTRLMSLAVPKSLKTTVMAATLGLSPVAAFAGHHDADRDRFRFDLDIHAGPVVIHAPAYEERRVQVWVDPVYRTVTEQQWIAPEYRTVVQRVWLPDQWEDRDVVHFQRGRRFIERQHVLVAPARYEDQPHQELVCDGHYQTVERQEIVVPGHWETRIERGR